MNTIDMPLIGTENMDKEQIIALIAESDRYRELMVRYRCAIMEIETKFRVLNEEFSLHNDRNPIETIKTRLKEPASLINKLNSKNLPMNIETIERNILDIAGIRVVCSFVEDVYYLADCFSTQNDIEVISVKDYIKNPKPNGYRSLHMTVRIPIFFAKKVLYVPVEIQFRTIAMDFWASLEHTIWYKQGNEDDEIVTRELKSCADSSNEWDRTMEKLLHLIQDKKKNDCKLQSTD